MDKNKYFLTGEFAKMMNVTKNTLFHYDKIGLFSPEIKLNNEYRCYSIQQVESMRVILMLKDLGMPLDEIKEYLDGNTADDLYELYEKESRHISDMIKDLKDKELWLKEQKEQILEFSSTDITKIYRRQRPTRYYFLTQSPSSDERMMAKKIGSLIETYDKTSQSYGYKISYIQRGDDIRRGVIENYRDIALILSKKPKGCHYDILPAGEYLTAYHKGYWYHIMDAYQRLIAYAAEHQILIDENFYETDLIDRLYEKDYKDFVTEIFVRVLN